MKLIVVAGARPNFIKIAPLMWEISRRPNVQACLVHTGQHYDERMSKLFFEQLKIPRPDVDLEVGSGSHAVQTAEVMKRFEPVVMAEKPDAVVVVGDVNSTVACALTSVKLGVPVAHVESGLRSFDRTMPEEINRIVTDSISQWLFVSETSGIANLRHDGIEEERIHFVGNVMIDTLIACREQFERAVIPYLEVARGKYAVLTLHRPSNVDDPAVFKGLMRAIATVQEEIPIVFPVHPRTRKALASISQPMPNLKLTEPLGYLEFMKLVSDARFVLTDSGGIQEETTYLQVPCLTLRCNTERPSTVEHGTNVLLGQNPTAIIAAAKQAMQSKRNGRRIPEGWDGAAAKRIMDILIQARPSQNRD
jgi:UDP-N-acetylglucosamine 2-epimerase (non-hydrolysing)